MPRPIQFDRNDVLNKALGLFWSDGYAASSISRLLNVMNLNRGSLYSSFTDKRALFKESLEFYFKSTFLVLLKPNLIEIDDPAESIREFFYHALLHENPKVLSKGCFLFNTVSELSHTEPDLAKDANNYLSEIRMLFVRRLEEAKSMGLVKSIGNSEAQANYLMGVLAGLRLQCKMGLGKEELKKTIDRALGSVFIAV
jgi:TetR/AcrR family transcriptional regulator, transcriptional repressor for nem operon